MALNRRTRIVLPVFLILMVLLAILGLSTPTPMKTATTTAPPVAGINKLTDAPTTCSITEGSASVCTVTISPAAPSGSSFTLSLTPRTTGQGAWTPVDASSVPGGGTGADVYITGSTTGVSKSVSITPGATSVNLPLTVVNDSFPELDETIVVTLSNAVNVTLGNTSMVLTIVDNDRTGIYDPVSYGATANNSSNDDVAGIQAAINAAAAGAGKGVVRFGTSGTYNVIGDGQTTMISVPQDKGIAIIGYGAEVKRKGASACIGAHNGGNKCGNRIFGSPETYNSASDSLPSIYAGLTVNGDRQNLGGPWDDWQSEQAHSIFVGGPSWRQDGNGTHARGRTVWYFEDIVTKNSPADGVSLFSKVDVTAWNIRSTDDFRGGLVATGGNSKLRIKNWNTYSTDSRYKTGVDIEIDGHGGRGDGSGTNGDLDMTFDSIIEDMIVDGDLDIGSYLPDDWRRCSDQSPSPGPTTVGQDDIDCTYWTDTDGTIYGSKQIFRNIQMVSGPTTISTARYHDLVQIENSTLHWGNNDGQLNRIVFASGDTAHGVKFVDVHNIVDNSPTFKNATFSTQGPTFQWRIGCSPPPGNFCVKSTPANISFVRSDFVDEGAPNSCVRQANKIGGTHYVTKIDSTWTLDCGGTGSDGPIDVNTGSGVPNTSTTTTTSPGATTTTAAPTTTTTTTTPSAATNKVQLESCTLGADVITTDSGTAVYGNNSVGSSTEVTCTVTNSGSAATYPMTIRYKDSASFIRLVTVNSVNYPTSPGLTYPNSNGGFTTVVNSVPLNVGSNTIKFNVSYITLDYFEFESSTLPTTTTTTTTTIATTTTTTTIPAALSNCVRTQAESNVSLTNWATNSSLTGASSGVAVGDTNFSGSATWTITVPTTGTYEVLVRSLTGGSGANRALSINGTSQGIRYWPAMESWTWQSFGFFDMTAGSNTIALSASTNTQGGLYLDVVDSCLQAASTTTTTTPTTTTTNPAFQNIVWQDEFDSFNPTSAGSVQPWAQVDPTWQNVEKGYTDFAGSGSWNANRYESIASSSGGTAVLDPFSVSGGVLTITNSPLPSELSAGVRQAMNLQGQGNVATPTRYGGYLVTNRNYTNPITGQPLEFTGGYYEAKIRFPDAVGNASRGILPAFWLFASLGSTNAANKGNAEIDIMESLGQPTASPFQATLHAKNNAGSDVYPETSTTATWTPASWHTFGLEFASGPTLKFYLDNTLVWTVSGSIAGWFTTPMSVRLSVASDAPWFASDRKTDGSTAANWRMQVDYVRVYSQKPSSPATTTTTAAPTTTTTTTSTTTTTVPTTTTTSTTTTIAPACALESGYSGTIAAISGTVKSAVTDRNLNTQESFAPNTILVDLGSTKSVDTVQLQWARAGGPSTFVIQTKSSSGLWVTRATQSGYRTTSFTCWKRTFASVNTRYVRIITSGLEPGATTNILKEVVVSS